MRHLTREELEASLDRIRQSPKDTGLLEMIVCRPQVDDRKVLDFAELDIERGLVGDNWNSRGSSRTTDGGSHPEMQITIMNSRVVAVVAQAKLRWSLAGDQLYVDMDLSKANLPAGSRIGIGSAILEVTEPPHLGCNKFVARFGADSMNRSICPSNVSNDEFRTILILAQVGGSLNQHSSKAEKRYAYRTRTNSSSEL